MRVPPLLTAALGGVLVSVALGACASGPTRATPPGTTAPASMAATAAPSPAGPTPTSATAAARAVLDGLHALAVDPKRSYRITFKGDSRHTTDILDVGGTLDVSGEDARLKAAFKFPRQGTATTEYRRVGGKDWVRIENDRWRALGGVDAASVVDPLAGAEDDTTMQYLGPVEGKTDRYRVLLTGVVLHPALIPATNLDSEEVVRTRLELVTDASGHPLSGTWSLSGTGRVSRQLQAIEMDLDLTFSRIGKAVSIEAP